MELLPILKGLATYVVPAQGAIRTKLLKSASQGGTRSAQYCYGVWLKHLCLLHEQGCKAVPERVAEFGPGESFGVGLAALLSGAQSYSAFDAVPFATVERNLALLDELAPLFRERAPRPWRGWPDYEHVLDAGAFPSTILTAERLDKALEPHRLHAIRGALAELHSGTRSKLVRYYAPWNSRLGISPGSFDCILSHSVLQYLENLEQFYSTCALWLKPGGWMSHQIDLSSMQLTRMWNGHWSYPSWIWKLVRGRRRFFMTGKTCSEHLAPIEKYGFQICSVARLALAGIARSKLAHAHAAMSDEDFECASLFIIARKH